MNTLYEELQQKFGVLLSAVQQGQITAYLELLEKWNRRINLTRLKTRQEQLEQHFFETFWAARRFLTFYHSAADIGSGAGFPGMALALFRPDLRMTLLEPNQKKCVFLGEVKRKLGLNAQVCCISAESYPGWGSQQIATIRALRPIPAVVSGARAASADLLVFHGSDKPFVPGFEVAESGLVPGTANRHITLLRCL